MQIGNEVEVVARGSCRSNLNLERKIAPANSKARDGDDDLPGIAVPYNMGWHKKK